jgi:hypothetical protein
MALIAFRPSCPLGFLADQRKANEPPRGKPRGIFKGKINFIAAPLGGISASLQQAGGELNPVDFASLQGD